MLSPEQINELLKLDDEALVDTHEAAAVVGLAYESLCWYRKRAPQRGPKYQRIGSRTIRYRMGDLRAFRNGDRNAHHEPHAAGVSA